MSERTAVRDALSVAVFAAAVGTLPAWLVLNYVVRADRALLIVAACFVASFVINVSINLYRLRRRR